MFARAEPAPRAAHSGVRIPGREQIPRNREDGWDFDSAGDAGDAGSA